CHVMSCASPFVCIMPSTAVIYPLSLHDALPICRNARPSEKEPFHDHPAACRARRPRHLARLSGADQAPGRAADADHLAGGHVPGDRKSTRLNSSHVKISYAVFCLKKKKV